MHPYKNRTIICIFLISAQRHSLLHLHLSSRLFFVLGIICPQPIVRSLFARYVLDAESTILGLTFIFLSHTAYLVNVNAFLHKLCNYLRLRCTLVVLRHHKLHHLLVGHRLSIDRHTPCQHDTKRKGKIPDIFHHICLKNIFLLYKETLFILNYCAKVHIFW